MTALLKWDAFAVRIVKDRGWPGMPESSAVHIVGDAGISPRLLTLTYIEIMEMAGHRKPMRCALERKAA